MAPGLVALVFGLAMAVGGTALCGWAGVKWVRARRGAARGGQRLRAVNTLIAGVLLLMVGAASLFAAGPERLRAFSLYRHLPLDYLLARAQSGQERAAAELYRRAMGGTLDAARLARVVRLAMSAEESTEWAALLRALVTEDRIDEAAFEALWRDGAMLHLEVREAGAVGDALPWRIRGDRGLRRALPAEISVRALRIGGREQAVGTTSRPYALSEVLSGLWPGGRLVTAESEPGEQAVECEVEIALQRSVHAAGMVRPARTFGRTLAARVRLKAPGDDPLRAVVEPPAASLRSQIVLTRHSAGRSPEGRPLLGVSLRVGRPSPAPLAFDVLLRGEAGELSLGTLVCPRGGEASFAGTVAAPSEGPWRYELVLRGRADVARATIDLYEYWAGELNLGSIEFAVPATPPVETRPTDSDEGDEREPA